MSGTCAFVAKFKDREYRCERDAGHADLHTNDKDGIPRRWSDSRPQCKSDYSENQHIWCCKKKYGHKGPHLGKTGEHRGRDPGVLEWESVDLSEEKNTQAENSPTARK